MNLISTFTDFTARHYKWSLTQVFDVLQYSSAIILEDNLAISSVRDYNGTIWVISATDWYRICSNTSLESRRQWMSTEICGVRLVRRQ